MKNFFNSFALVVVLSLGFFSAAQAQETEVAPTNAVEIGEEDMVLIADVDFENGEVDNIKENQFEISFDVINHHIEVLSDLIYSVQIVTDEGVTMDEVIYRNDPLTISSNSNLHKIIKFNAPNYLEGDFNLILAGHTIEGTLLENYEIGKVSLKKMINEYIENVGCYVHIEGVDGEYPPYQGLDISVSEKMEINCYIKNLSENSIKFNPYIEIYEKSVYSGKEALINNKLDEEILGASEEKAIKVVIPNPGKAGYYDASLVFLNSAAEQISNNSNAHFVVQGVSGGISDARFDKSSYKKGDIAVAEFTTTGSAQNFPGSRFSEAGEEYNQKMSAEIEVSSKGKKCSENIPEIIPEDIPVNFVKKEITINSDCFSPIATITLRDENGNILDKKEIALTQSKSDAKSDSPKQNIDDKKNMSLVAKLGVIFLIIFLATVTVVIIKKKPGVGLFSIFLLGTVFFSVDTVKAATYSVNTGIWTVASVTYDASSPSCGKAKGYAYMTWTICHNNMIEYKAWFNPTTNSSWPYQIINKKETTVSAVVDGKNYYAQINPSGSVTVNSGSGNKTGWFRFSFYHSTQFNTVFNRSDGYSVATCQVCGNGVREGSEECDAGGSNGVACSPAYGTNCWYCSNACVDTPVSGGYCGDWTVNGTEQCDQGSSGGNECTSTCQTKVIPVCGNGTKEGLEQCDDGNTSNGDGCNSTCLNEVSASCGNRSTGQKNGSYSEAETYWDIIDNNKEEGDLFSKLNKKTQYVSWCQTGSFNGELYIDGVKYSGNPEDGGDFPQPGQTTTWECGGYNGGSPASCSATRDEALCILGENYDCAQIATGNLCDASTCVSGITTSNAYCYDRCDPTTNVDISLCNTDGNTCADQTAGCPSCPPLGNKNITNWIEVPVN